MITIGGKIKRLRKSNRLTLEELAKKIEVTSSTIYKYENNKINIPSDRLEKLAKALNCSAAYLMGWEEDNKVELKMVARNKKPDTWVKFNKLSDDKKKVVTDLINLYFDTEVEEEE